MQLRVGTPCGNGGNSKELLDMDAVILRLGQTVLIGVPVSDGSLMFNTGINDTVLISFEVFLMRDLGFSGICGVFGPFPFCRVYSVANA